MQEVRDIEQGTKQKIPTQQLEQQPAEAADSE